MGSKKKTPKPPQVQLPGFTQPEKDLMSQQTDLIKQLQSQSGTEFNWAGQNNDQVNSILNSLSSSNTASNPLVRPLSDQEMSDINSQYDAARDQMMNNFNTGSYKDLYDRNQADTIASLASRGVLDSTSGSQALSTLEGQRQSDLNNAELQAYQNKLAGIQQLRTNLSNTDLSRAQTLGGLQSTYLPQSTGSAASATTGAQNLTQDYTNQRMAQYNNTLNNAQSQYAWSLANFNPGKSGGQRAAGAATGALSGAATGAMVGGPWGAAIGGTLGAIGGLF